MDAEGGGGRSARSRAREALEDIGVSLDGTERRAHTLRFVAGEQRLAQRYLLAEPALSSLVALGVRGQRPLLVDTQMRGRKEQRRWLATVDELALRIRSHVAAAPIQIYLHVTFETRYLFIYLSNYLSTMHGGHRSR